jgi:hypothetical protein
MNRLRHGEQENDGQQVASRGASLAETALRKEVKPQTIQTQTVLPSSMTWDSELWLSGA